MPSPHSSEVEVQERPVSAETAIGKKIAISAPFLSQGKSSGGPSVPPPEAGFSQCMWVSGHPRGETGWY